MAEDADAVEDALEEVLDEDEEGGEDVHLITTDPIIMDLLLHQYTETLFLKPRFILKIPFVHYPSNKNVT